MNPYRIAPPPRRWEPRLSPKLVRLLRPIRRRRRIREQRLVDVVVRGAEEVRRHVADGSGVLITPNHSSHADPYSMYAAADEIGMPFYFMSTWHVFENQGPVGRWMLQRHGVFSIDREGTDMAALKQAVGILGERPYPLVIFPEGEVYHCNDRLTPVREGAAVVALTAAKRSTRPLVCIPCALKYEYVDDPNPELLDLMRRLEQQVHWRPKTHLALHERIYAFAEAAMALKEIEFLGTACKGTLPERTDALASHILARLETHHEIDAAGKSIPERVKELRRRTLESLEQTEPGDAEHRRLHDDLDDLFLVVQLFSYPGDYVAEKPSLERMAETLDKFEEDVLGVYSATIRGRRKVTVRFAPAVAVQSTGRIKTAAVELTEQLQRQIQTMLDEHSAR